MMVGPKVMLVHEDRLLFGTNIFILYIEEGNECK